ncbi:hypothetical protein [Woodsholea maritima]|uniref:hypothetical protein n=1 Tax=Woodsholea maritima TaxID=240237 RepID=UPI000373E800|nr:hypothetical protein [Woodsholea maritima]
MGDSALWYKIAEANGLSGQSQLIEGQSLLLPTGVMRNSYNATTFTPYDPNKAIGNLTPSSPSEPRPVARKGKKGCGGIGQIFMVVIAVAVTLITKNVVLGGKLLGSTTAASAAAGAVGSIASQAFGVATGIQDKFSWNAVAMAGISGGIGAGLGKIAGDMAQAGRAAYKAGVASRMGYANAGALAQRAQQMGSKWGALGKVLGGTGVGGAIARGVTGSALGQGAAMAFGWQSRFDWAGLAAAGVSAGVGQAVGQWSAKRSDPMWAALNNKAVMPQAVAEGLTIGSRVISNAATRSLIDGTSFGDNVLSSLPDVIGQTIGSKIAKGIEISRRRHADNRSNIELDDKIYAEFIPNPQMDNDNSILRAILNIFNTKPAEESDNIPTQFNIDDYNIEKNIVEIGRDGHFITIDAGTLSANQLEVIQNELPPKFYELADGMDLSQHSLPVAVIGKQRTNNWEDSIYTDKVYINSPEIQRMRSVVNLAHQISFGIDVGARYQTHSYNVLFYSPHSDTGYRGQNIASSSNLNAYIVTNSSLVRGIRSVINTVTHEKLHVYPDFDLKRINGSYTDRRTSVNEHQALENFVASRMEHYGFRGSYQSWQQRGYGNRDIRTVPIYQADGDFAPGTNLLRLLGE